MNFISLLIISILATAALISVVKKTCSCKLHKFLVWLIAAVCSVLFGIGLYLCNDMDMGKWAIPVYSVVVYALQFVVSQEALDAVVTKFINKLGS